MFISFGSSIVIDVESPAGMDGAGNIGVISSYHSLVILCITRYPLDSICIFFQNPILLITAVSSLTILPPQLISPLIVAEVSDEAVI